MGTDFIIPLHSSKECTGNIHSFESMGTVDGPGVRFVVFLAGCPLRCKYCHNIDVVEGKGESYSVSEVLQKVQRSAPYFGDKGGITVSGGDPVAQPKFVAELLNQCQKAGIHTCIDTSLMTNVHVINTLLPVVDLWLVSVKHMNNTEHKWLTDGSNTHILENIRHLSSQNTRLWLRFLLLPGYTDTEQNIADFITFAHSVNFECIELLSYHTMGKPKWKALHKQYELESVPVPTKQSVLHVQQRFQAEGFTVVVTE